MYRDAISRSYVRWKLGNSITVKS